jgi:hypothetical protein
VEAIFNGMQPSNFKLQYQCWLLGVVDRQCLMTFYKKENISQNPCSSWKCTPMSCGTIAIVAIVRAELGYVHHHEHLLSCSLPTENYQMQHNGII